MTLHKHTHTHTHHKLHRDKLTHPKPHIYTHTHLHFDRQCASSIAPGISVLWVVISLWSSVCDRLAWVVHSVPLRSIPSIASSTRWHLPLEVIIITLVQFLLVFNDIIRLHTNQDTTATTNGTVMFSLFFSNVHRLEPSSPIIFTATWLQAPFFLFDYWQHPYVVCIHTATICICLDISVISLSLCATCDHPIICHGYD